MSSDLHSQDLITRQMLDVAVPRTRSAKWSRSSHTGEVIMEAEESGKIERSTDSGVP